MVPKLLLVDGHSMAYRAFYALPAENFTTATGQHTNAIYGFATMLISLIKEEKPTHIAVAFDVSRKTFRTDIFPEYKATRAATPDEFRSQMSFLHQLVKVFGISQFELAGYEADDILATLAKQAENDGFEIVICSGDRDSFQLVNQHVTVLYPKRGVSEMARMTPEAIVEKYGMSPQMYPDFAALRGDPSDNLPSVPGVGEKTAAKWVTEYGSLKNLVANIDKIPGKVGDSLRANIVGVLRNRELTQLLHEVPLAVEIADLAWSGIKGEDTVQLFDELEFRTLKDRIRPLLIEQSSESNSIQEPLMMLDFNDEVQDISSLELSGKIAGHTGDLAIIFEIQDSQVHRYAVALSKSESYCVHSHEMGPWIADPGVKKIMHDAKSLGRIVKIDGVAFDTALAAYVVNPGVRTQEIDDLISRWGTRTLQGSSSSKPKIVHQVGSLFDIRNSLMKELEERTLLGLFQDLEMPIARLLTMMERRGIAVDSKKLLALRDFFASEVARETTAAHAAVGHEFNVASPKQLQVVLFDELKLPKTKKIKTGYTTDAESLEWLAEKTNHPVLRQLLRIRETAKLKTTVEGLLAEVGVDGRIHTHFAQTVAATGRLSSTGPNLQNIPVRTEEGRKIRDCFIAGAGFVSLLTADYSQIEMRIMAHLSHDEHLLAAFASGEDLHSTVASEVFGVATADVTPEMRRQIKAMSYGLAYGLSSYGLSAQLGITPPEAQNLMDTYFERFGGIRDYLKTVVEQAKKVGFTETILGRRRYLPDLMHDNRQRREVAERMALNAPIQGSAADIIKVAMLAVEQEFENHKVKSRLLLQVHDELIVELAGGEEDLVTTIVRDSMGSAYPLKAPLAVNVGIGFSWSEAAH
ncbi:MAG: DNA polymerase I [Actinobacteria bacterium]|nr:DNA polymerase I [Actinomycetota bacterium]